jgi:hypothetical protein
MKRHKDALAAQGGACNSLALANALVSAIREARAESSGFSEADRDPAVRLIAHQLAYLLKLDAIDNFDSELGYLRATQACERRASEPCGPSWQEHEQARAYPQPALNRG